MYDGFWKEGKKHGLGVFRLSTDEHRRGSHGHHNGWQPHSVSAAVAQFHWDTSLDAVSENPVKWVDQV